MRRFGAVVLLVSIGCADRQSPTQPTLVQAMPAPAPQEFRLSGSVNDTADRPLGDARVEVIAGSGAGTIATTDGRGRFRMPGMFSGVVSLRASKDGHVPLTRTGPNRPLPSPAPDLSLDFYFSLQPDGPNADLSGIYTLEVIADAACASLPDEARRRRYTATVFRGDRPTTFNATVTAAPPPQAFLRAPHLEIGVAGDFARLGMSLVERLGEHSYVVIEGAASAMTSSSGINAPLNAQVVYCSEVPVSSGDYWACVPEGGIDCASVNHQVALVRR
jgi:hypothetical protein